MLYCIWRIAYPTGIRAYPHKYTCNDVPWILHPENGPRGGVCHPLVYIEKEEGRNMKYFALVALVLLLSCSFAMADKTSSPLVINGDVGLVYGYDDHTQKWDVRSGHLPITDFGFPSWVSVSTKYVNLKLAVDPSEVDAGNHAENSILEGYGTLWGGRVGKFYTNTPNLCYGLNGVGGEFSRKLWVFEPTFGFVTNSDGVEGWYGSLGVTKYAKLSYFNGNDYCVDVPGHAEVWTVHGQIPIAPLKATLIPEYVWIGHGDQERWAIVLDSTYSFARFDVAIDGSHIWTFGPKFNLYDGKLSGTIAPTFDGADFKGFSAMVKVTW